MQSLQYSKDIENQTECQVVRQVWLRIRRRTIAKSSSKLEVIMYIFYLQCR
jgi:hypothetical protein